MNDIKERVYALDGTFTEILYTNEEQASINASRAAAYQQHKLDALAAHRREVINSGMTINGIAVLTDETSRMDLIGAYIMAQNDPEYTVDWKTPNGFVVLNSETLIMLGEAVASFVQKAFSAEATITGRAANYSSVESIIAAFDQEMGG